MAKRSGKPTPPPPMPPPPRVRVVRMEDSDPPEPTPIDDSGLSLEDLGQAYAALLNRGAVPYEEPAEDSESTDDNEEASDSVSETDSSLSPAEPLPAASDAACELSPKSILEAMLFVGHPQNEPLTSSQVASLMRGVLTEEIDELVRELNAEYAAAHCPYRIASEGVGYRLTLRDEFSFIRDQFYGRIKEARLSQSAIDTLAIVAYHQPVTVKKVDELRSRPSGGLLSQLVRRQLVRVDRDPEKPKEILYRTTSRFLDLFGLESLDDLPRSQEVE